jgi:hypothetical protein
VRFSFLYVLHLAIAREDRALADEAAHVIERMHEGQGIPLGRVFLSLVAAYRQDDPWLLGLDPADYLLASPSEVVLWFLCERGARTPAPLLEEVRAQAQTLNWGGLLRYVRAAEALASGDNARLAVAIEEAEAGQLVPHAARMRIVLAQRTGDRAHLERVPPRAGAPGRPAVPTAAGGGGGDARVAPWYLRVVSQLASAKLKFASTTGIAPCLHGSRMRQLLVLSPDRS